MSADQSVLPAQRKALKARAHRLEPVVWIGNDGLSDAVVAEIDRALAAQELIKVRAAGLAREARENAMLEICARCAAEPVQHIGKVLVLYRKKPEPEKPARKTAFRATKARPKAWASAVRESTARPRGRSRGKA